ncbi:MAG: glutathione synthase, partial [Gammaproteobacteria bacterium]|nr:glutathione synthase [Gammaproteobacteria bacterium]
MTISLGVVMDPISAINPKKDSTLAMLIAAQARGWSLRYMEMADLSMHGSEPVARVRALTVRDDLNDWYELDAPDHASTVPMGDLDVVLMRKDPPFDIEYIYATYILEQAQHRGTLVVNAPRTLRDANEKMFTAWFPQCTPPTLVTRRHDELRAFLDEHGDIV